MNNRSIHGVLAWFDRKKKHLSQKDNSLSSCVLRKAPSNHKCPFKEKLSLLEALISQENITRFPKVFKNELFTELY